jgi:hypothetical protein
VQEADLFVILGQVLQGQAGHSGGVCNDCERGPVPLKTDVIVAHALLLAAVEHDQSSRPRRLTEECRKILQEPHSGVVRQRKAHLEALVPVYATCKRHVHVMAAMGQETYIVLRSTGSGQRSCTRSPPFAPRRQSSCTPRRHGRAARTRLRERPLSSLN